MKATTPPKDAGIGPSKLLEKTLASLDEAILVVNPDTRAIVSCNRAAENIFGYPREEIIGRNTEFLHVDRVHYEAFGKALFPALDATGVFHKEFMMRRRDGSLFPTDMTVTEIRDDEGARVGVVSAVRDITVRKRIEDALRESEERYRSLFENSHAVLLVINPVDGSIMDANPAAVAYYGWTREELQRKKIMDINTLTPDQVRAEMDLAHEEKRNHFIFKHRRAHGEPRDVEVYSGPIKAHGKDLLYSIIFDITERKRAEEDLRKSGALLNATQQMTRIGGWELDVEKQSIYWTDEVYRIHDFDPGEIAEGLTDHIARSVECYNPEDRPVILAAFTRCAQEGVPYDMELPFTTVKGRKLWVRTSANPVFDKGKVVRVVGNIMDITERKNGQLMADSLIRRNQILMQNALEGIHILDDKGKLIEVNDAFCHHLGYTKEEALQLSVFDWEAKLTADELRRNLRELLDSHAVFEAVHRRKDGSLVDVEVSVVGVELDGRKCLYTTSRDITERKKAEAAVRESEERYRSLVNASPMCIHEVGRDGRIASMNQAGLLMMDVSDEKEVQGLLYLDAVCANDRERIGELLAKAYTGEASDFEFKSSGPSGQVFKSCFVPIRNQKGDVEKLMGITEDVTGRKRAEEALHQSEALFRNYFDLGQVGMAITSLDQKWLRVNDRLCEMLGYTKDELTRMTWTELTHPDDLEPDLAQFRRLLSGEIERYEMDKRFFNKNGNIVYTHLTVSCQRKPDKSVEYIIASVADITERKRAEEQLRLASAYTRNLIETSLDPLVTISSDGRITDVNSATERVTGLPRDKIIGTEFSRYFTEPEKADIGYREAFSQGFVTDYPLAISHASGKITDVLYNASVYRNERGEVAGVFAAARDITERKRAEMALAHSERFMRTLTDTIPGMVGYWTDELRCAFANKGYLEWFGKTPEQMMGIRIQDLMGDELFRKNEPFIRAALRGEKQDFEWTLTKPDGSVGYTWAHYIPDFDGERVRGFFVLVSDITELKKAGEALKERDAELREAQRIAHVGSWRLDSATNQVVWTEELYRMLGLDPSLPPPNYTEHMRLFTPESWDLLSSALALTQEKGVPYELELEMVRPGKSNGWMLAIGEPVRDARGAIIGLQGVALDITERKQGEEKLRNRDKQYHTLLQSIEAAVVVHDSDTHIITINKKALELLGLTQDQALGKTAFDAGWMFMEANETPMPFSRYPVNQVISSGKAVKDFVLGVKRPVIGDIVWVIVNAVPVLVDHQIKEIIVSFMDITYQKKAEAGLIIAKEQAESATRLKDQFVSLVAHDLRSPFTSMMGLLRIFTERKSLLANDDDKKIADTVFKSGERMMGMIDQLLKISRLQTGQITPQPRFFNGHTSVAFTINAIGHNAAQKGIEIINDVPVDMRLYADTALFDEVLLNLMTNSIKFCSRGDKIAVFTPPGLKSAIAVRDTGKGVGEKMLPDIFRHDVKTTSIGTDGELGTGLGLPYSYDIMKAHGGELTVESATGKGSVFCAALPYARPVALVVDDDPMALLIVRSHLEKIDIDVVEASDGAKALSAVKARRPHIIITDIMMHGMDGFELLDRLKQDISTRGIPVIVMTSVDGEMRDKALRRGADDFVGKPIIGDDFVPRVRRFVG